MSADHQVRPLLDTFSRVEFVESSQQGKGIPILQMRKLFPRETRFAESHPAASWQGQGLDLGLLTDCSSSLRHHLLLHAWGGRTRGVWTVGFQAGTTGELPDTTNTHHAADIYQAAYCVLSCEHGLPWSCWSNTSTFEGPCAFAVS